MKLFAAVAFLVTLVVAVDTAAAPQKKDQNFEAIAIPHRIEFHAPPPGRIGNRDLLHWVIHDRYGRAFGVATLDCSWYRGHERMCVGVFRLARGSFAVSGNGQSRTVGEFIVTSGTGAYTFAHGTLQYNATRRGRLVLHGAF